MYHGLQGWLQCENMVVVVGQKYSFHNKFKFAVDFVNFMIC